MPKQKKMVTKKKEKIIQKQQGNEKRSDKVPLLKGIRGKAIILTIDLPRDVTFAEEIICGRKLNTVN